MTTGTDLVREAVSARQSRLVTLAGDVGISTNILDAFMRGDADLPVDALQSIVREIWNGAVFFDPDADALCFAPAPPARLWVRRLS
jgi:hypothetical protein